MYSFTPASGWAGRPTAASTGISPIMTAGAKANGVDHAGWVVAGLVVAVLS